jgi:hypothetical protein
LICTILAIPLPILLPAIPGLTPRLVPALLPAPTAARVVVVAGGRLAAGIVERGAPILLAPSVEVLAAELAVRLVEAARELVGRLVLVVEETADPRVPDPLAFLVVGTNPPGFLAPIVDCARGFETTRFDGGRAGEEGGPRLFAFIPVERGLGIDDFIAGDEANRGRRVAARC